MACKRKIAVNFYIHMIYIFNITVKKVTQFALSGFFDLKRLFDFDNFLF